MTEVNTINSSLEDFVEIVESLGVHGSVLLQQCMMKTFNSRITWHRAQTFSCFVVTAVMRILHDTGTKLGRLSMKAL